MGPQEMLDRAEVKNKWQLTPLKDFKSPRLTERMWRTAVVIPFYMLYQKQPFGIPAFLCLAAGLCLVLWCNLALQADSAIQPGIVVYFVVLYTVGEERVVFYTLARILDTGIGVLISLLCYLLLPSKYDKEQGLSFRTMWKATKHAFQSYKDKNRLFREDEQKNFGMKNKK